MTAQAFLPVEQALEQTPSPLLSLRLIKTADETDSDGLKFAGIASDEGEDVEGDTILRKALDLTYAQQRGYVNWHHSRAPEDQIGFLTACELVNPGKLDRLEKKLGVKPSKTASVFVEGQLYAHMPRAVSVANILKSTPNEAAPALGLSLDGAMAKSADGDIVKAYVRGVAISPVPAHPKTLVKLAKCLADANSVGGDPIETTIARVAAEQDALRNEVDQGMTPDEAVLWVLKQRPYWTYDLAWKFVYYTIGLQSQD